MQKIHRYQCYRFMKLSFVAAFVQCLVCGVLWASPSAGQDLNNVRVTLALENGPLATALKEIERKTRVRFVYDARQLQPYQHPKFDFQNILLKDCLKQLLQNTPLEYSQVNEHVVIAPRTAPNQRELVRGKVLDASTNEPLPGVNVIVKDTKIGTATDTK
jgi:TonB-dependent starch-binding outer membrane protein SusC